MGFVDTLRVTCARIDSADRAFFERRPQRKFRLRQAHSVECDLYELNAAQRDRRWFIVLENTRPGYQPKCALEAPKNAEVDIDDEMIDFLLFCSERGISI